MKTITLADAEKGTFYSLLETAYQAITLATSLEQQPSTLWSWIKFRALDNFAFTFSVLLEPLANFSLQIVLKTAFIVYAKNNLDKE